MSGVSMEEEGVDMVQYTKAYNAMGRVMTALDEALDTLINKTGLVGR
ncbi:MAG: flagellar basal body rod C-terminal domain-containing protein [Oscillospiraceae bacterium]